MKNLDLGNFYNYSEEIFDMIESDVMLEIKLGEPFTKQLTCGKDRTDIYGVDEAAHIRIFNKYQCASKEVVSEFMKAVDSRSICIMGNKDKNSYYSNDPDYSNIRFSVFVLNVDSGYTIMFNIDWYPVSYHDAMIEDEDDSHIVKSGYCDGNHCIEKDSDGTTNHFIKVKGGRIKWRN